MGDTYQQTEEIVVFVKPSCVQCNATFNALDKRGLEYEVVDITTNRGSLGYLMNLGYIQAPVIIVGRLGRPDEHWSGFRPDRIKDIVDSRLLYA